MDLEDYSSDVQDEQAGSESTSNGSLESVHIPVPIVVPGSVQSSPQMDPKPGGYDHDSCVMYSNPSALMEESGNSDHPIASYEMSNFSNMKESDSTTMEDKNYCISKPPSGAQVISCRGVSSKINQRAANWESLGPNSLIPSFSSPPLSIFLFDFSCHYADIIMYAIYCRKRGNFHLPCKLTTHTESI